MNFFIYSLLQSADYLLHQAKFSDLEGAFSDATEKMAVVLAAITSSYHHRCAFLKRMTEASTYDVENLVENFPTDQSTCFKARTNSLSYTAPMVVLNNVQLSGENSYCQSLKSATRELFEEHWNSEFVIRIYFTETE